MQSVQITIRDLPNSPALEDHIRKKAQKLTQFHRRINSCRIVITIPQKHKHNGKLFCVRIDLTVPGKELVVNHKLDEDVYIAIRDAFNALTRQLEQYARKRRGEVKMHEAVIHGKIKKLHPEGYGFIEGIDGNEYYFSAANVTHPHFDQLLRDDAVCFLAIPAGEGLQANRVTKEKRNHFVEEVE